MNKICRLSAITLLASSTSLMAQSKSFEGASLGVSFSAVGVELAGNSTSGSNTNANTNPDRTSGTLGKVAEIASLDLAYTFATGANGAISVGASYTPGKAKAGTGTYTDAASSGSNIIAGQTSGSTGSISVEVKDPYTIYIAPTYVVSKDAAMYVKVGYSKADVNVANSGSGALTQKPNDLEGWTYGIGSKIMLTPNAYVGVEASITDYDSISATRATSQKITVDPKVVQASLAIGYKF